MAAPPSHRIACQLVRVKDGDTYVLAVNWTGDSGYELAARVVVRLAEHSAPESNTEAGKAAKAAVTRLLGESAISIEPKGHDKYGRLLAWVWCGESVALGPWLEQQGLARPGGFKG